MSEPFADWLRAGASREKAAADASAGPAQELPDEEGLGSVFVNWLDQDNDMWVATWQSGERHRETSGTREQVLAWARNQTARYYWLFTEDGYVPLPRT